MKSRSLIVILLLAAFLSACSRQPRYSSAPASGDAVMIDTSLLRENSPQFYTHVHEGKNISFFVLKIDGKMSSFLDACASCYMHKQGYRSEDGIVVCRYCNMKFSLNKLEKGLGGCYPIKLEGIQEDNRYRIPLAMLEKESGKF